MILPAAWDAGLIGCLAGATLALLVVLLFGRGGGGAAGPVAADLARDRADLRVALEQRLASLAESNAVQISAFGDGIARRLEEAVGEQFASVHDAARDLKNSAGQIADLRRLFSSVRARGAWGESQLRALLDDVLPVGGYETACRIKDATGEQVEFAIRMPSPGLPPERRPLLAVDSKFPADSYERLLAAEEAGDEGAARAARRALDSAFRTEARRIASKYIAPPRTVDYAILYVPTDGLYVEAARLPGLLDELGRVHRVLVMGPAILPGLLRSIQLGAMTLALGERAEAIASLLARTRHDVARVDEALERVARHGASTASAVDEARRRVKGLERSLETAEREDG